MTEPWNSPYQTYQPSDVGFLPPTPTSTPTATPTQTSVAPGPPMPHPMGAPPSDLVGATQLRAEAAGIAEAASRGTLIAICSVLGALAIMVATIAFSPGGYYFVVFGPIVYAAHRHREASSLRRKAAFFAGTADLWAQGQGADGQLLARSAVVAEFSRRETKVQAKKDAPMSKWVWIGLVVILVLLMILIASST